MSDFKEELARSDTKPVQEAVAACICREFDGVSKVERASKTDDKKGIDYWVVFESGKRIRVDAKIREKDFADSDPSQGDLALEIWSVMGEKVGWTMDESKATDYVVWYWKDTDRSYNLPFPPLCMAFKANFARWVFEYKDNIHEQSTEFEDRAGYDSQCIFVPCKVVLEAMAELTGDGQAAASRPILDAKTTFVDW